MPKTCEYPYSLCRLPRVWEVVAVSNFPVRVLDVCPMHLDMMDDERQVVNAVKHGKAAQDKFAQV